MPTGYTALIYEGEPITFRQFALRCARGISHLYAMHDHGLDAEIPPKLVPNDYYEKQITEAKQAIARLEAMTNADADHAAAWEYEQARRRMTDGLLEMNARRNRLQAMLAQVDAWAPPSPEHDVLKAFMREQLEGELRFCMGFSWPEPQRQSGATWKDERLVDAREDLERSERRLAEERARCDEANAWLSALRESLPGDGAGTDPARDGRTIVAPSNVFYTLGGKPPEGWPDGALVGGVGPARYKPDAGG